MLNSLTLIAFNEANFDLIEKYTQEYEFESLKKILNMNKYITKADEDYKLLEPWIQWVTVYTGESSADHGVHRLGGSRRKEKRQIFEAMEQRGAKILALSPMNAVNRLKKKNRDLFRILGR